MTEKRNNIIFIAFLMLSCLLVGVNIVEKLQPVPAPAPLPTAKDELPQPQNVIGLPQDAAQLKAQLQRKGITPHPASHWKALGEAP